MAVIDPDEVWALSAADGLSGPVEFTPAAGGRGVTVLAEGGTITLGADVGDGGRLGVPGRQWVVRSADLDGAAVGRGATLTDADDVTWVVAAATLTALGTAWACQCVRSPVASDFGGTAIVRRAAVSPAAGGLPGGTSVTLATDVPCAVRVDGSAADWDQATDRYLTRYTGTAYLGAVLDLLAGDTIETGGVVWNVVRSDVPDPLGLMTAVVVERSV